MSFVLAGAYLPSILYTGYRRRNGASAAEFFTVSSAQDNPLYFYKLYFENE